MRGCWRSSCHQVGENGCSCQHTWHILGTGLRAKDFEPASFPCAEESHYMPVSYRKIAAEEFADTQYTWAEDPAAYARQAQQMSLFESAAHGQNNGREVFRDPAFRDNRSLPSTVGCRGLPDIRRLCGRRAVGLRAARLQNRLWCSTHFAGLVPPCCKLYCGDTRPLALKSIPIRSWRPVPS